MFLNQPDNNQQGFTLVEMVATVSITGIIGAISLITLMPVIQGAETAAATISEQQNIQTQQQEQALNDVVSQVETITAK